MQPFTQKELIMLIIQVVFTLVALFAAVLLLPGVISGPLPLFGIIVTSSFWVLTTSLLLSLTANRYVAAIAIAVPVLLTLIAGQLSVGVIGGALFLLLMMLWAYSKLRHDLYNHVKFKATVSFRNGIRLLLIGWMLALAGLALPLLQGSISKSGINISEEQIDFMVKPFEPAINNFLPGVSPTATVDDLIDQQLAQQFTPEQIALITPEQRELLREQVSTQFGNEELKGNDSISSIIAKRINGTLETVTSSSPILVALFIIILALLTVRILIPIMTYILIFIQAGIIKLLVKKQLLRIELEPANIEKLKI